MVLPAERDQIGELMVPTFGSVRDVMNVKKVRCAAEPTVVAIS